MAISLKGPMELVQAVEDLVKASFSDDAEVQIELRIESAGGIERVICRVNGVESVVKDAGQSGVKPQGTNTQNINTQSAGTQSKQAARAAFVRAVREYLPETHLPWGILTGIRPTKIVHRMMDRGTGRSETAGILRNQYLIENDKIQLALDVAELQRPYLLTPREAGKLISVYVGIPFCPSRCSYCSFPSYVGNQAALTEYLPVLTEEIEVLGRELRQRGIGVQTVYIGGGTPTILPARELSDLLASCRSQLASDQTVEVTVEAGRPDTLNREKFELMAASGVNRISINPQSMVGATLQAIGRDHSPEDIATCYQLARSLGFTNINMDIILGLPGESLTEVEYTLDQIARLEPDSLTVHALAIKRASLLKAEARLGRIENKEAGLQSGAGCGGRIENETRINSGIWYQGSVQMQEAASRTARSLTMRPYYLYRQKQILGNLENIGYAKQGKESIYNIQIMEERQTIFGLGAGAASKMVRPGEWTLTNYQHPKDIKAYRLRWRESLQKKLAQLDEYSRDHN